MFSLRNFLASVSKALSSRKCNHKRVYTLHEHPDGDSKSHDKHMITICDKVLESNSSEPLYCCFFMECDYFWMSDAFISQCLLKFQTPISKMNHSYEFQSMTINTQGYKDTTVFAESLFMFYMYLKGHLWGPPCGTKLSLDYHLQSENMLLQLCLRGIYTLGGTNPGIHLCSSHSFVVLIKDDIDEEFVKLLDNLFKRGVNVYAKKVKMGRSMHEYIFVRECNRFIYTDKLTNTCQSQQSSDIVADFGIAGMFSKEVRSDNDHAGYLQQERELSCSHSLFYVHTWSQSNDSFRVEDVLLQIWLPFNGKFGVFNNVNAPFVAPLI